MDEIDNKALNEQPKDNSNLKNWILWLQDRIPSLKESANIYWLKQAMEGFASMREEQAKKEWEKEKQALEAKIKHLTQVINYQE